MCSMKFSWKAHLSIIKNAIERLNMESYNRNVKDIDTLEPKTEEFKSVEGKILALQDLIVCGDHWTKRIWDNMSCGFNAWIYKGYMYIIPWAHYNSGK